MDKLEMQCNNNQGIERFEGLNSFSSMKLFDADEKEKAEIILKSLEGLSIISASELLDKCKFALNQVVLNKII